MIQFDIFYFTIRVREQNKILMNKLVKEIHISRKESLEKCVAKKKGKIRAQKVAQNKFLFGFGNVSPVLLFTTHLF